MRDAGIASGDILIVDRAVPATDNKIVIAILDGELTVKRIRIDGGSVVLMPELFAFGYVYKKAGVMLSGFLQEGEVQRALVGEGDSEKQQTLMHTVDGINCRFGTGSVTYAAAGMRPAWGMRQTKKSPQYTTAWDDILTIKI